MVSKTQTGHDPRLLSRRRFLQEMSAAAAGLVAAGCVPGAGKQTPKADSTGPAPSPQVAIAQATSYDRTLVRQKVRDVLDAIGGLRGVVHSGDRVAIKVNLTGGTSVQPLPGVSAIDSYVTHPEVVRALGELVRDAGARDLYIVEAVYEWESYKLWGYEEVAEALHATLIDLNDTRPYSDFATAPVGDGWFIYKDFTFNHILQEVDAFISVPKIKCHYSAGVTHSLKNLVGLVPCRFYRLTPEDTYRSGFHGQENETGTRLPRVIVDLNRARPIHLALLDGIKTTEGGEGPWIQTLAPVEHHVLIAGKDPVATDAVATATMGFDPAEALPNSPFLRSDNHLVLAHELGLGTHRLEDIQVVGATITDVRRSFQPCW